jgi:hypothetical protein
MGVFGDVERNSESETPAVFALAAPEPRRERLRFRFGVGDGAVYSSPLPPGSPSAGSFAIRPPSRLSINWRAAVRSPPETVLLRPNLPGRGGGGVGDGEGSYVSVPPVSLCMAMVRAADVLPTLLERKSPRCKSSSDGRFGVGGRVPG